MVCSREGDGYEEGYSRWEMKKKGYCSLSGIEFHMCVCLSLLSCHNKMPCMGA